MPNVFTIILFFFTLAVWVLSLEMVYMCMTPNSIVIVGQPFRLKIVSCSCPNIIYKVFFFLVANISCHETSKIFLIDVRYQA